jgi:hypothetical protein
MAAPDALVKQQAQPAGNSKLTLRAQFPKKIM